MSDQVVKEVTGAEFSENASEVVLLDEIAFVWEKKRS
jgi:protein-disulfide isomerase-like protein with CxxC motif